MRSSLIDPHELIPPSAFYKGAWGKHWPEFEGTIYEADIVDNNEHGPADDDVDGPLAHELRVPPEFKYRFFRGMKEITSLADLNPSTGDVLVIREEYEKLLEALQKEAHMYPLTRRFIVTGHPGIGSCECWFQSQGVLIPIPFLGKTTFLFYHLVRRLELKLPTAVQLNSKYYLIFDEQGATVHPPGVGDERLEKCWALADSDEYVTPPFEAFKAAECVILTTSQNFDKWERWKTHGNGAWIVMNLPSVPEIAAVL